MPERLRAGAGLGHSPRHGLTGVVPGAVRCRKAVNGLLPFAAIARQR